MSEEKTAVIDITEFLIKEYGFDKVRPPHEGIDFEKFSCVLRVHEIHYLFWSEHHKHFSISVRHELVKGLAGGGSKPWTHVMIPKTIYTIEEANGLIEGIVDFEYLKVIER